MRNPRGRQPHSDPFHPPPQFHFFPTHDTSLPINVTEIVINDEAHDFRSILSSFERDFLVRNNGNQVLFEFVNFFFHWMIIDGCLFFFFNTSLIFLANWLMVACDVGILGLFIQQRKLVDGTFLVIFLGKYGLWEWKREEFMLALIVGFISYVISNLAYNQFMILMWFLSTCHL